MTCPTAEEPEDLHEWISFEDPHEERTWVFDATYLSSNFTCIYGQGCKGILDVADESHAQGCCSVGAHFVDEADADNVRTHFARVAPQQMQFHRKASRKGPVRDGEPDEDGSPTQETRLADDACIFLNRPGFEGGVGCALHIAAVAVGERPMDWKPQVCWQVPLRLEHSTDDSGHVTSRLREWKRRDWGEGGNEFGWWCTESADAFVGEAPLYVTARDEIVELVGLRNYEVLRSLLERPDWIPIEHPVVRRRR